MAQDSCVIRTLKFYIQGRLQIVQLTQKLGYIALAIKMITQVPLGN